MYFSPARASLYRSTISGTPLFSTFRVSDWLGREVVMSRCPETFSSQAKATSHDALSKLFENRFSSAAGAAGAVATGGAGGWTAITDPPRPASRTAGSHWRSRHIGTRSAMTRRTRAVAIVKFPQEDRSTARRVRDSGPFPPERPRPFAGF